MEGRLPTGLPADKRQQALDRMRARLLEAVAAARQTEPGLGADAAALRVLNRLGTPLDADSLLAGLDGPSAGSRLQRVVHAGARGKDAVQSAAARNVRRAVQASSLVVALLLLALAANALDGTVFPLPKQKGAEGETGLPGAVGPPTFRNFTRDAQVMAETGAQTDSFTVPEGVPGVLKIRLAGQSGCLDLSLRDPAGKAFFVRTHICQGLNTDLRLETPGVWQLEYEFLAWTGRVDVSLRQAE